jgi:uncharacterized protein YbjT (DUF2867 family)
MPTDGTGSRSDDGRYENDVPGAKVWAANAKWSDVMKYVIMGGTGHVGSAASAELLRRGEEVIIVTRDARRARQRCAAAGFEKAEFVEANVEDTAVLRAAFRLGSRAFLLNPPADPKLDTDATERHTVAKILEAIEASGLKKVVVESTGGAQAGECLGDLNVLWELEQGLARTSIPTAINRAGYYMSNWDDQLDSVRNSGTLHTMFPADLPIPMVSTRDLGVIAANRLASSLDDTGIQYVEGPRRYTSSEVASAFSRVLRRPVQIEETPRHQWKATFKALGFSEAAARSYARMTAASVDSNFDRSENPVLGPTTLEEHIEQLVGGRAAAA